MNDYIENILREKNIPEDFKYAAVAESSLNPRAVSSAGAEGLWQFLEGTAAEFGLSTGDLIDERCDYVKSTEAAAAYFLRAYSAVGGSWTLASASFNLGIRGVTDRMTRQRSSSYWEMVFPPETEEYLPRIIAIKLLMEETRTREPETEKGSVHLRSFLVTSEKPVYLKDLASHFDMTFREVWQLNPHIWKPYLPPGTYRLYLRTEAAVTEEELSDLLSELPYTRQAIVLEHEQSISAVSQKLGIDQDELLVFNESDESTFKAGQEIVFWTLEPEK